MLNDSPLKWLSLISSYLQQKYLTQNHTKIIAATLQSHRQVELTNLCLVIQKKYTNGAEIQSNHVFEQYDAYPQDRASCLTTMRKNRKVIQVH